MSALCFLTARGHMGDRKGREWISALVAAPKGLTVCYIGAPHGDDARFTDKEVSQLEKLGFRCVAPRLSDEGLDREAARRTIVSADVLYLAGGDTIAFAEAARAHDLVPAFAEAFQRARLVYGVSGGTCAAAPFTIGYKDDETPYVAECLGVGARLPLDVHDEADNWPEMRALLQLRAGAPGAAGIVIPSGSALVITPDGQTGTAGRQPCEVRRLDAEGGWRIEALPPTSLDLPK